MSNSVLPHRWQPTRLPRPWDSPGKNTGMGCHCPLRVPSNSIQLGFLGGSDGKESACNAGDSGSIPGLGRSAGEGNGHPLLLLPSIFPSIIVFASSATAKSLQSCPTLCDPIDGSPPGSPIPGILQATTLEWVAISFSNAGK